VVLVVLVVWVVGGGVFVVWGFVGVVVVSRRQRARQRRFLEPIDMRRQRVSRHKPFSPLLNLIKAHKSFKKQLRCETDVAISF
jgi:hypothetical protein